jgi:hypothetical protein
MLELETHKAAHEGLKIEVPEKTHQEELSGARLKGHARAYLTQIQESPYKKR